MDTEPDYDLQGVSTTTLWTLNERATEAARTDSSFHDPAAVELQSKIDYPWHKFGKPTQPAAVRATVFDDVIRRFRAQHPDAPVIALGEGLQTSYWRIDDPTLRWFSVDLQPVIDIREALLPHNDNITNIAASALDRSWFDQVPTGGPAFLSVEGLLMYFTFDEVRDLITDLAATFPGGQMAFDSIPKWFSKRTIKGLTLTDDYQVPPMPVHFTFREIQRLAASIDNVTGVRELMPISGRQLWPSPTIHRIAKLPVIRSVRPNMALMQFA